MIGEITDVVRLAAIPVFAYAAWNDYQSRRVPNKLWLPILAVGALTLLIDVAVAMLSPGPFPEGLAAGAGLSLFVAIPLAFLGWRLALFGGADAKAIMALAILFPTAPSYQLAGFQLPISAPISGPFVGVIVVNGLIVAMLFMTHIAIRNALSGRLSFRTLHAMPIDSTDVADKYGLVLTPNTDTIVSEYAGTAGVDAAVLRRYQEWRGIDQAEGWAAGKRRRTKGGDRWGTQKFVDETEGPLYGATQQDIRDALNYLSREEAVWFSPAVPYVVPLFVGMVLSLSVGFLPTLVL